MTTTLFKQVEEKNRTALLKQQIINLCIQGGGTSISELSKALMVSVPTVTKFLGELIDEGFVYDFGKQENAGGRQPNIYGLNPHAGYFIGVELRKKTVQMAAINFKAQVVANREEPYLVSEDSMESIDRLCGVIRSFIARQKLPAEKILAIGVSISGRVNPESGYSYSYFFVEEQPLVQLLEERLGHRVYIENDTRAATYGEYMSGVGNNEKTMLYINASWGLGLGMILDGKLFYGKSGFSGEYGHFPMFDNEVICRCGKRGCLETGVSGSAVHRIFLERLAQGRISMLSDKFRSGAALSLDDILDAVLKEDVLAIEIMESVGHKLGKALAGLINMFNPELIVLGGTLATTRDYLMLPVKSAINKYSLRMVSKDTQIKFSRLGENAGVVGACLLARGKSLHLL